MWLPSGSVSPVAVLWMRPLEAGLSGTGKPLDFTYWRRPFGVVSFEREMHEARFVGIGFGG